MTNPNNNYLGLKTMATTLCALMLLQACGQKKTQGSSEDMSSSSLIDTKAIEAKGASKEETAEALALAAEKMALNPTGFFFAGELTAKALEIDPQNTRARFYQALLKPFLAQRGIWARIEPWMKKQGGEIYRDYLEARRSAPESNYKQFLLDGKPDIVTIKDIQDHFAVTRQELLATRDDIKGLKHTQFQANFVIYGHPTSSEIVEQCSPKKLADGVYEIPKCPEAYLFPIKLARPDFEALALSYSAFAAGYTWIFTAYSIEGLQEIQDALKIEEEKNGMVGADKALAIIKSHPEFLQLRDPQALKEILSLGTEGTEALNYALKHQPELCRHAKEDPRNRRGYLYGNGFCAKSAASHAVALLNANMRGPVQIVKELDSIDNNDDDSRRYLTTVNVEQILTNPIQDLKSILPEFDTTNGRMKFADESLGGLFLNNDASAFFNFGQNTNGTTTPSTIQQVAPLK